MAAKKIDISKVTSKSLKERKYLTSFPEYYELGSVTENNIWHDKQNVLDHVIAVYEGLENILEFKGLKTDRITTLRKYLSEDIGTKTKKQILKIATLLHDIAKADVVVTRPDGIISCPGHDLIGAARVKLFAERFGLDQKSESYTERIVRYHSFISEILNLMIANSDKEKYLQIFKETVGDVGIELILLMRADLLGSDLDKGDKKGFEARISLLNWMMGKLLEE